MTTFISGSRLADCRDGGWWDVRLSAGFVGFGVDLWSGD